VDQRDPKAGAPSSQSRKRDTTKNVSARQNSLFGLISRVDAVHLANRLRGSTVAVLQLPHLGVGDMIVTEVHVQGWQADEECTDDVADVRSNERFADILRYSKLWMGKEACQYPVFKLVHR
jgi:hypothetical protein